MSQNNDNSNNLNGNGNDNGNDTKTEVSLFTQDMQTSLWYDNNSMYTSAEAVKQFNGVISSDHVKQLTEYVVDSCEPLPAVKTYSRIQPYLKERNQEVYSKVTVNNVLSPAVSQEDKMHWDRTNWVEGGYKFTTDENKLTTMIDKRLENDLGQQSEEGNRVFRSNVYVSFDVDAALALEGKSRVCKTGEAIVETEYAYSTPKVEYAGDDNLTFMIIDHDDYNNNAIRFYLNSQPDECILTISETNAHDVIAAIGRYVRALDKLVDFDVRKYSRYFIVLSNAKNPLRCARCIVNINGNIIGDDYSKFRFGSTKQIAAATGKAINVIQNYAQYEYNYLEVASNSQSVYTGIKTYSAKVNTSYIDFTAWNNLNGTNVTWPALDGAMPMSRQKWNIQDYYTALHYLVEYHYKVNTPYAYTLNNVVTHADWNLLHPTSEDYGSSTLPIAGYAIRVALDKNMCKPVNDHTHYIEHRGILGSKLKVLADYRSGRLCATISETFGSFYNVKKIKDLEMINLYNEILDAQTVGIYDTDHLLGMIGHVKYSPDNPGYIAQHERTLAVTFSVVADPINDDLLVEEYWPIGIYWRSDAFGLPAIDELDYKINLIPQDASIGWKTPDKKKYFCGDGIVAKITYQFDKTQAPVDANVIFQSKLNTYKSNSSGMYICPGLFFCDCVFNIRDRPNGINTANAYYVICNGNRMYTARLSKNLGTDNRSKLFG